MNIHAQSNVTQMPQRVQSLLQFYDHQNRIDPKMWVEAKSHMINKYFSDHGLKAAIIAISGGIDSALVYALIHYAKKLPNSPIQNITAVFLPSYDIGATGQKEAQSRVDQLRDAIGGSYAYAAIDDQVNDIVWTAEYIADARANGWACGQAVAYTRTPHLYITSSILTASGFPAIILGTTNQDEGSYLGYVGKASDAMVDLQVISDLRKNHVHQIAEYLGVPECILSVEPTGDMFDGRTDVEVFGTSYEYARLYQYLLLDPMYKDRIAPLSTDDKNTLKLACNNLEQLHRYNAHKYLSGSQAVHLDIFPTNIKGGWNHSGIVPINDQQQLIPIWYPIDEQLATNCLHDIMQTIPSMLPETMDCVIGNNHAYVINNSIPDRLIDFLLNHFGNHSHCDDFVQYPTDNHGQRTVNMNVGSWRQAFTSDLLPKLLLEALGDKVPRIKFHEGDYWRLVGVNSYMRHMRYAEGSLLHAHRDGNYSYSPDVKNLMSVIVYLTDNESGATRFLIENDDAELVGGTSAIANDWKNEATENDVQLKIKPKRGQVLVFDTQLLHDSERVAAGHEKVVLLTELTYQRIITPNAKTLWRELEW